MMPALSYQPAPFYGAQLPIAIDYQATLALRQMAIYTKVFAPGAVLHARSRRGGHAQTVVMVTKF